MIDIIFRFLFLMMIFVLALVGIMKLADLFALKEELEDYSRHKVGNRKTMLIITIMLLYATIAVITVSIIWAR